MAKRKSLGLNLRKEKIEKNIIFVMNIIVKKIRAITALFILLRRNHYIALKDSTNSSTEIFNSLAKLFKIGRLGLLRTPVSNWDR